ncbi:secretin N-terminal domain-containing protein [Desulfurispira natronophila]|uniref:General secretion pathway protein D n=1 Tax=Desulfurispira natronophila TaxID=682562 RepID=A0A7W7Y3H4_9BACT|nr:secretin N-terminal domain-containing protein [Desulfurispira natronophila]MBB5021234.1 general secretion pathway protein D [Desulfurispira natronophila]
MRVLTLSLILALFFVLSNPSLAQEPTPGNDDTWTVNLKEAEISALVDQVSAITGRSFVVDPRVRGKVTVVSQTPMDAESIYELFLVVLSIHGFIAVEGGEATKILPNAVARQAAIPLDSDGFMRGEVLITRVIPLQNTPAAELIPILRPLVPQYGHLAGVPSANAIIISDHAENVSRIAEIVERLDQEESELIKIVDLEHAWVGHVGGLLEQMVSQSGRQERPQGAIRIIADERSNRLILKGTEKSLEEYRSLIQSLDVPVKDTGSTQVIRLNHADAVQISDLLKALIDGQLDDSDIRHTVSIQADESLNALVIRAEPSVMTELQSVISQLDIRRAQVLIEAVIVEVVGDSLNQLGVQLAARSTDSLGPVGGTSFSNAGSSLGGILTNLATQTPPNIGDGMNLGVATSSGDVEMGALLQALSQVSNANLLSTPSVLTLDNQEARILVGQNVPVRTGSYTTDGSGASNPFTTIQRQDVGIVLRTTPSIYEGDAVRMQVELEASSVLSEGTDGIITNKREIQTTILADNNETIVLGGLIKDDVQESISKVPLLGDIPLIGRLFQARRQRVEKRNLLVFLRPTILLTQEDSSAISRRQYQGIYELQMNPPKMSGIPTRIQPNLPENLEDLYN